MPATRRDRREGQASGAGAHDGKLHRRGRGVVDELRLVSGLWIDEARCDARLEGMVEARLVARDARVDALRRAGGRLGQQEWIGEEWACHRDEVGRSAVEDGLGNLGSVDAVGRDKWDGDGASKLGGDPREAATRHTRRNRRDARLVPSNPRVDQ